MFTALQPSDTMVVGHFSVKYEASKGELQWQERLLLGLSFGSNGPIKQRETEENVLSATIFMALNMSDQKGLISNCSHLYPFDNHVFLSETLVFTCHCQCFQKGIRLPVQ